MYYPMGFDKCVPSCNPTFIFSVKIKNNMTISPESSLVPLHSCPFTVNPHVLMAPQGFLVIVCEARESLLINEQQHSLEV